MKIRLKVNGIIIALAVLLIAVFPAVFLRPPKTGPWDEAAEAVGITFILLGQLLRTCARGYKSEHSQEGRSLIQGGPYNLVRNPMYLGILLIGVGMVLVLFQWWAAVIFLVVFTARYILLIFQEEKKLLALFPQEYSVYCLRVPRLLPPLKILVKRDISVYLPLRPAWLKKEIGTTLAVLLITLLLEFWQDIKVQGIKVYFKESIAILVIVALFVGLYIYLSRRTANISKNNVSSQS